MTQVVIKMKQRFRVIGYISFSRRTFSVVLIFFLYVLELFGLVLICLFPIEKTKNISVSLQMRFGFLYFVSFFRCIYIKVQTFTHQINQKFLCIFTTVSKKLKSSHTHICTAYSQYPITRLIKANIF